MIEIVPGKWINPQRVAYLCKWETEEYTRICFSGRDNDHTTVKLPIKRVAEILNYDPRVGLIR